MLVWQLPVLLSSLRSALPITCWQMSSPLPEVASLASRFRVVAISAFLPVKPAVLELLAGVSEQPPSVTARQAPPRMNTRDQMAQSLRDGGLDARAGEIESCRRCPRLVSWREQVACDKRAAHRAETYWGRPIAGFGDPGARVAILGLAPGAHGANRTGRVFTGDRSGDFLFAALWRAGLANQRSSRARDDGLLLHDVWVTAAVRCVPPANRPTPAERDACLPFARRELALLPQLRVIVCLGAFAWDAALRLRERPPRPRPRFAHGGELDGEAGAGAGGEPGPVLLASYHVSQQNTFTGRLTEAMFDAVLARGMALAG
jgi:uracil-DNA glycosylase family 4